MSVFSAVGAVARRVAVCRAAFFYGARKSAKRLAERVIPHLIVDRPALLVRFEYLRSAEQREMPGDDGHVDIAALCDLADGAQPPAFGEARKQTDARRIAQGTEQLVVELFVDRETPAGRLSWRAGPADGPGLLARLRHGASIGPNGTGASRRFAYLCKYGRAGITTGPGRLSCALCVDHDRPGNHMAAAR